MQHQAFSIAKYLAISHLILFQSCTANSHRLVSSILLVCTNHYPDNRLAIATPRTPDARSAQSNIVIVRFQSYAPALRCRRMATTRLQPFGKGKKLFPAHPSWSRDFIKRDSIRIGLVKIKCVCSKSKVKDVKYISLFETLSLQREFFNVIARRD